jgi:hypothetical protein
MCEMTHGFNQNEIENVFCHFSCPKRHEGRSDKEMRTIGGNKDLSTNEQHHGTLFPVGGFESAAMMFVCSKI